MKALVWHGTNDVRVERVPDPAILNPRDAIVRVTTSAICGSDLHLLNGYVPAMQAGDILGHEFMGEVVEVGPGNHKLKRGDRVVVPFTIACGNCYFCKNDLWSCCDNSNPNAVMAEKLYGYSTSGLFGYSHLTGGYAGGQAQYARVPYADVGPLKIPDGIPDEKVLFLSDCRKGGIVSIPGVYGGFLDKIPFGAAFQKGLTFKMGQTHMLRYMKPLLDRIESGELDPSFVITHRVPLDNAPGAYKIFRDHEEGCIKVVLNPHPETIH